MKPARSIQRSRQAPQRKQQAKEQKRQQKPAGRDRRAIPPVERREVSYAAFQVRADSMTVEEGSGDLLFTAVLSSETPAPRAAYDWNTDTLYEFDEILAMAGVDLTRAPILPMLTDHDMWNVYSQVGDWTNIRVEGTDLLADGRVFNDEQTAVLISRMSKGGIKTFSIGYTVEAYEEDATSDDERLVLRATAWTLYEGSIVAVPADHTASVRALGTVISGGAFMKRGQGQPANGNSNNGRRNAGGNAQQPPANQGGEAVDDGEGLFDDDGNAIDADGNLIDENGNVITDDGNGNGNGNGDENDGGEGDDVDQRQVQHDIALRRAGRSVRMTEAEIAPFLGTDISPRSMVERHVARSLSSRGAGSARQTRGLAPTPPGGRGLSNDAQNEQRDEMIVRGMTRSALYSKGVRGARVEQNSDTQPYARWGAADLFRHVMERNGCAAMIPHSPAEYGAALETGRIGARSLPQIVLDDFAFLAGRIVEEIAISTLDDIPFAGSQITKPVGFSTYFDASLTMGVRFDRLKRTGDNHEIRKGGISVYESTARLEALGGRYPISRRLFETNAVGMFNDIAQQIIVAGRLAQNDILAEKLNSNPLMSDGLPFWNVVRGNVHADRALTVTNVAAARADLKRGGIASPGVFLVVGLDNELAAEQIAANTTPTKIEDYNPFGGKITPVGVNEMPEGAWMLMLDPRIRPALLDLGKDGQDTPIVTYHNPSDLDGFEIKAVWDRGIAYGDPLGAVLNFVGDAPEEGFDGSDLNYGV